MHKELNYVIIIILPSFPSRVLNVRIPLFTYSFRSSPWGVRFILHSVKRLQFKNNATTSPCCRHVRHVELYLLSPRPTLLSLMKHTWGKNNKTVKEYWKQVWKIKKMAAETRRIFFWLSKTFSGNFLRAGYPSRVQVKFKGKQKTQFLSQSLV